MQKIKRFVESDKGKDILTVLIVILVGLGSFELGRLSKGDKSGGIKIEYTDEYAVPAPNQPAGVIYAQNGASEVNSSKNFFASNRGSKYYPVDCSAGKSIVENNKVWFDTREAAETAGYELSGSCR